MKDNISRREFFKRSFYTGTALSLAVSGCVLGRRTGKEAGTEMSAWCITYTSFHVPTHFGTVTFE